MKRLAVVLPLLLATAPLHAAAPIVPMKAETALHQTLGLTVYGATVQLPRGRWAVADVKPGGALEQAFVVAPESVDRPQGRRTQAHEIEEKLRSPRAPAYEVIQASRTYAEGHGGVGPESFNVLDREKYGNLLAALEQSPWRYEEDQGKKLPGPFFFLIPGVLMPAGSGQGHQTRRPDQVPAADPLMLELRPYVDDGKHWVLLSDGRQERRPIDPALVQKYNLKINPVLPKNGGELPASPAAIGYSLYGLLPDPAKQPTAITLRNRNDGATLVVSAADTPATKGDTALLERWAKARFLSWTPLLVAGDSPILRSWAGSLGGLYGKGATAGSFPDELRERVRSTDALSVLGGRAALRETLQMEQLRLSTPGRPAGPMTPLADLPRVEVKSHPFEQMLAGAAGGRLPLADHVPAGRFFVWFAKPAAFFPFIEEGGDFLFRSGSIASASFADDDLNNRYLRRLGLDGKFGRKFLESGEVLELAIVAPDLFFVDGTDLTIIMRVKRPDKVASKMKDLGVADIKPDGITEKPLPSGRSAFWARQADLLIVGTNRAEIDAVLALAATDGAGSLGRTAEFRFMLTRLTPRKETRAYVYFSDPFIRRMVSPEVKIGQLRRIHARAEMELITAGALLYLLDGGREKPTIEALTRLGYVPAGVSAGAYRLRDDLSVSSPVWGSPAELTAIGAVPVAAATPDEATAYRSYIDEYTRYWRQYFDPVAMRLDDGPGGDLELETFILPLLQSQIYDQLRTTLTGRETGQPLRIPTVTPEPVLLLSLNLNDPAWVRVSGIGSGTFTAYTGIDPALFDLLGPGMHLALQDGDPIIALGNADILGGFSGPMFTEGLMRSGIPILVSVLTRPCKILFELRDEQAALGILRRSATGRWLRAREMQVEFRQVGNRDAWIYSIGVAGVVKIRFGIEVQNGYLVLSNIPWSQPIAVGRGEEQPLNGAELRVAPGAVRLGLSGLFATESEQNQRAAVKGLATLLPLLLTVSPDPQAAAARHAALFGWRPLHPGPGEWIWKDGEISSSVYGTADRPRQPAFSAGSDDFGLFQGVDRLRVNMQLEGDGLRAAVRWRWTGSGPQRR